MLSHSFLSFWQLNHNYFSIFYFLSSALLEPGICVILCTIFCFFSLLLLLVVFFNFKVTQARMPKDSIIFPEITLFSQRSAPFAPEASAPLEQHPCRVAQIPALCCPLFRCLRYRTHQTAAPLQGSGSQLCSAPSPPSFQVLITSSLCFLSFREWQLSPAVSTSIYLIILYIKFSLLK